MREVTIKDWWEPREACKCQFKQGGERTNGW
jgi:hypothetical protein